MSCFEDSMDNGVKCCSIAKSLMPGCQQTPSSHPEFHEYLFIVENNKTNQNPTVLSVLNVRKLRSTYHSFKGLHSKHDLKVCNASQGLWIS